MRGKSLGSARRLLGLGLGSQSDFGTTSFDNLIASLKQRTGSGSNFSFESGFNYYKLNLNSLVSRLSS